MSFKSRYLEQENARLRTENRTLLACLLERAGHRTAADMLRQIGEASVTPPLYGNEPAKPTPPQGTQGPVGRGWRAIVNYLQDSSRPEQPDPKQEEDAS